MTNENNDDGLIAENYLIERHHAVTITQSLQDQILQHHNACPVFCIDRMQDAFALAFSLSLVKKRRPLLIYIHHDNSVLNLFSSDILNEFLRENYIVWAWDITDHANRDLLIKMWKENFSKESFINFSLNQCPVLIGIMRPIAIENNSSSPKQYEYQILFIDNGLVHTNEQLDLESLLYQLIVFKQEFDKNEQYLLSDFVRKIVLCRDVVLDIAEYLSLNDAIAIYSLSILPLLWECKIKLPIIEPSEQFMRTTIQKIKHEQIVSLRIKAGDFKRTMQLASLDTFTNVKVLTLDNLQKIIQIYNMKIYFPNLICLSIHYDGKAYFHSICKALNLIPDSTKRFEIHCDSIHCSHYRPDLLSTAVSNPNNVYIESVVLYVNYTSTPAISKCAQGHTKCILRTITDSIRIMSKIRSVRVIINTGNVETLLDIDEWTNLVERCLQLNKITLKVIRNMSHDTQFVQKIREIQDGLHHIRQSIKYNVRIQ